MSDREKQLDRIDDRNAQVDAMTTDTKPSEAALEIARKMCRGRKIYLYGGLPEFCGHNYGWAGEKDIALLIDAGVREMREAGEKLHVVMIQRNMTEDEREVATDMWNALRAWRPK